MSASVYEILSASPNETLNIGAALARWLRDGDVVLMHGDLGAGKTTLTKGIAAALGIDAVVSSPSFSIVNEYDIGPSGPVTCLFHLDLYRLQGADDLASIGFDDFTAPADGVTVVEWPERAVTALPDRYLLIEIEPNSAESRLLRFFPVPDEDSWNNRFATLRSNLGAVGSGDSCLP